jgi:hypothetical protein
VITRRRVSGCATLFAVWELPAPGARDAPRLRPAAVASARLIASPASTPSRSLAAGLGVRPSVAVLVNLVHGVGDRIVTFAGCRALPVGPGDGRRCGQTTVARVPNMRRVGIPTFSFEQHWPCITCCMPKSLRAKMKRSFRTSQRRNSTRPTMCTRRRAGQPAMDSSTLCQYNLMYCAL